MSALAQCDGTEKERRAATKLERYLLFVHIKKRNSIHMKAVEGLHTFPCDDLAEKRVSTKENCIYLSECRKVIRYA